MDKSIQVVSMYILTHMGLIFFMYPADIIASLSVGHWLAILVGYSLHVLVIFVYTKGLGFFPGQDLIDILLKWGKPAACLLLLPVAVYFFTITVITLRACSEIITIIFLTNTPLWAIIALLLAIPAYMASIGLDGLMRTGTLLTVLSMPLVVFLLLLSFQNADWRYLFPLIDKKAASFSFLFDDHYLKSLFAFAGGFLFLGFIPPYVSYSRTKLLWASTALLPVFLVSVYGPILTFGQNTASKFQFPYIMNIDTINIDWLMFDRITMFFLLITIMFVMLFTSIVLWKIVRLINRPLKRVKSAYLLPAVSLIIFVASLSVPDWTVVEKLFKWNTALRLYVFTVIPAVTLIIGLSRKKKAGAAP